MRDLLFFIGGFAACLWFVWGVLAVDRRASERLEGRGVMAEYGGADANPTPEHDPSVAVVLAQPQADETVWELSGGGGGSARRPHLSLVKGDK